EARRNVVHHSGEEGIATDAGSGGSVYDNRVYANVGIGVHLWNGSPASGNTIYDNALGIQAEPNYPTVPYYSGTINNNLIYANSGGGIIVHRAHLVYITSNTISLPTGDGISFDLSSDHSSIRNNTVWTQSGYNLNIPADSQV